MIDSALNPHGPVRALGLAIVAFALGIVGCFDLQPRDLVCNFNNICPYGLTCCSGVCKGNCNTVAPFAGKLEWVHQIRGLGFEEITDIESKENAGDFMVSGRLKGSQGSRVSLDAGDPKNRIYAVQNGEKSTFFLAQYTRNGNAEWARTALGGISATIDAAAQVQGESSTVAAGRFAGEGVFDVHNGKSFLPRGTFLLKYDANGDIRWARTAMTDGTIRALAVGNGDSPHFFTGGTFNHQTEFLPGVTMQGSDCERMFIAKYESDGSLGWVESGDGCASCVGLTSKDRDSVVGAGYFEDTLVLGSGENGKTLEAQGTRDIFIVRYTNIDGGSPRLDWVRHIYGRDQSVPVTLESSDGETVTLASNIKGSPILETEGDFKEIEAGGGVGNSRVLLARYFADRGRLKWAKVITGQGDVIVRDIAVRDDGYSLVVGEFTGLVSFGVVGDRDYTLLPLGGRDIFIAFFDDDGRLIWARREGGPSDGEGVLSAAFAEDQTALVGGTFTGVLAFAFGSPHEKTLVSAGHEDGFLLKIRLTDDENTTPLEPANLNINGAECDSFDTFDSRRCPDDPGGGCIRYVDGQGAQSGHGKTWQTAFKTVQEGIDSARCATMRESECETAEVWVAKGTYTVFNQCREATLRLRPGVEVLGGFRGDETSRAERNPKTNETILDGSDGVSPKNRVYHVVTGSNLSELNGFTIRGGRADGEGESRHRQGGGMLSYHTSPRITQCVFTDNYARETGGGIAAFHGSPVLREVTFRHNESGEQGGGFYGVLGSPTIVDCSFENNHAGHSGGGLALEYSDFDGNVIHSRFESNSALVAGGGVFMLSTFNGSINDTVFKKNRTLLTDSYGAGTALVDSTAQIDDCSFIENTSEGRGGGLAMRFSRSAILRSAFQNNIALEQGGGAVFARSSYSGIDSSIFLDNRANTNGGGFYGRLDFSSVVNSVFVGNSATTGAGLSVSANDIVNCTIADNTAKTGGGGVFFGDGVDGEKFYTYSSMINSISRDNTPYDNGYEYTFLTDDVAVEYSNIGQINVVGHNNFSVPPEFVDGPNRNYRLKPNSPCIDAADSARAPSIDIEGYPRHDASTHTNIKGIADMGAYEYTPDRENPQE